MILPSTARYIGWAGTAASGHGGLHSGKNDNLIEILLLGAILS